jgi:hypothetical protein
MLFWVCCSLIRKSYINRIHAIVNGISFPADSYIQVGKTAHYF